VQEVFGIVNEHTRAVVDDPVSKVLQNGLIVGLANHTVNAVEKPYRFQR